MHSFDASTRAGCVTRFPQAERWLREQLVERSPVALPAEWADRAVRWVPLIWVGVALLGGLNLLTDLVALTLTASLESALHAGLSLAGLYCATRAIRGLFARSATGWTWAVYATGLDLLAMVLYASIFGVLISALMLWFWFQLKPRYTVGAASEGSAQAATHGGIPHRRQAANL